MHEHTDSTPPAQADEKKFSTLKDRRVGPFNSYNPVTPTQIWQWCSAMGDHNPCFAPGPEQLAPPAMMQMWTMRDINGDCAPGSTADRQYQIFDDMTAMGFGANVAVSYDITFHRYLSPGERVQHYSTVISISEKKQTALGEGFFVTEKVEYLTAEKGAFAEALITYYQYRIAEAAIAPAGEPASTPADDTYHDNEDRAASSSNTAVNWRDIDAADLAPGLELPRLAIPITHTLIVGGAIATQDFVKVHHSEPAARAAGMPDIFMNILTTCGLSARYLGEWAGPRSRLKTLAFKLQSPNHPGDLMELSGEVAAIETVDDGDLVTVDFRGANRLGLHTSGRASLLLPD